MKRTTNTTPSRGLTFAESQKKLEELARRMAEYYATKDIKAAKAKQETTQ